MGWIGINDKAPTEQNILVMCESEHLGMMMHTASLGANGKLFVVGNHFAFDMPKVTHWMPLPEPPT